VRILYHHRTLADGAEGVHIAAMVDAFRALGHDVVVRGLAASPRRPERRTGVHLLRSALPAAGFELASAVLNVPEYSSTRRAIGRLAIDLVYKRHARFDTAVLAAARRQDVPSVLEVNSLFSQGAYHEFEPMRLHSLATRLERRALELATVVAAVSTPLMRQIQALVPREVIVLPNGADPERFAISRANPERVRREYCADGRLTVGWSGVLRQWHGVDTLLEAIRSLPQIRLLMVGDGPARESVERRAQALGVADRLSITGRVPHEEMIDYIAAMDIGVVADDRTGVASPMKLLEYMAMGRPVVAPRLDSISDIVTDEADGLLFEPGNGVELTRVLCRLAADEPLRRRLGLQARATIERERNWRRNAERVLALGRTANGAGTRVRAARCEL
jgi:glycosyltransferase involved in cell wall biosynthesis